MNRQLTLINTNDSFWYTNNYKTWDKVYPTHLQKKDLVIYYISTPGWFMQKRPGNYIHISTWSTFFPNKTKNISTKAVNISTSLPLSFWSWIGLVISGRWRSSCLGLVLDCTAYSWAVWSYILGCLQAQAQAQWQLISRQLKIKTTQISKLVYLPS